MGVKKGQLPISLKQLLEAANLHVEIISHDKFDTVTHLGQITNFNPF